MTTTRTVRDDIKNILDFLVDAELALFANEVSMSPTRVSFQVYDPHADFLLSRDHPSLEQYISWVSSGAYSAILLDGSLLQMTYDVRGRQISGHRLAYIPCPFDLDLDLLACGDPIVDIVELHMSESLILRSPIRFDFDPDAEEPGHPAAHMTLNSVSCRIGCVAPMHAMRFTDFVFRNFYPDYWKVHREFFKTAEHRHIGEPVLAEMDRRIPHFSWDVHAASI